jgi:hypothetical protein
MKAVLIISLSLSIFSFITPISKSEKADIYIYLASGYNFDTVSLSINNTDILNNEVVSSNKGHNDISDIYIKLKADSVFVYKGPLLVSRNFMAVNSKILRLLLCINNRPYSYSFNLKKGRFLFISKHSYFYNVYFNQFKKPVSLY